MRPTPSIPRVTTVEARHAWWAPGRRRLLLAAAGSLAFASPHPSGAFAGGRSRSATPGDSTAISLPEPTGPYPTGWRGDLTLLGARHASYTDTQSLLPQIARKLDLPAATVERSVGTIAPDRWGAAQRAYVTAFFDRRLYGRDSGLLDHGSPRYPKIRFSR
ncbi:hypothetical protein [Streptomyces tsukubensis]|uniref:Uncharacterized protein n=1 Tax=Streptomyces tsukubensis TaxID=83656 RepID=A0A1V4A038_9ACTN|nr:hypothetical protein [Streptomyces tsukubensis]OON72156.1 hypothetical protein B1H18_30630 [Streptomyces tsukubensis]QFR97106.1 hypothetical protein GBW32_33660 [Streptomyces tsukubensis]